MTPAGLRIERLAGDEDLAGVLAVEAESFNNPWTRQMYEAELLRPGVCHVYVARLPGCPVVGFCAFWLILDEAHINNVALRPAWRGQGIGAVLVTYALAEAERRGAPRATLEVRRSNEGAQRFYQRLGFRVEGVRPRYYSQPEEDALVLWRGPA